MAGINWGRYRDRVLAVMFLIGSAAVVFWSGWLPTVVVGFVLVWVAFQWWMDRGSSYEAAYKRAAAMHEAIKAFHAVDRTADVVAGVENAARLDAVLVSFRRLDLREKLLTTYHRNVEVILSAPDYADSDGRSEIVELGWADERSQWQASGRGSPMAGPGDSWELRFFSLDDAVDKMATRLWRGRGPRRKDSSANA